MPSVVHACRTYCVLVLYVQMQNRPLRPELPAVVRGAWSLCYFSQICILFGLVVVRERVVLAVAAVVVVLLCLCLCVVWTLPVPTAITPRSFSLPLSLTFSLSVSAALKMGRFCLPGTWCTEWERFISSMYAFTVYCTIYGVHMWRIHFRFKSTSETESRAYVGVYA